VLSAVCARVNAGAIFNTLRLVQPEMS